MFLKERDFAGNQIQGARDYQEDAQAFVALKKGSDQKVERLLTVLTDGMGGANGGDYASESVLRAVVGYCAEYDFQDGLAMRVANETLVRAIIKDSSLDGMGCTLLATVMTDEALYWLSVGDSPLYLYRDGQISQINEDHSMMPLIKQLVDEGKLQPDAMKLHPHRNVLRSVIAGCKIDLIDCPPEALPIKPGDIVIVASDGIQTLSDESIGSIIESNYELTAEEITDKLLDALKDANRPRQDNASINVIRIPVDEPSSGASSES